MNRKQSVMGVLAASLLTLGLFLGDEVVAVGQTIANFSQTWDGKYTPGFAVGQVDIGGVKVTATATQLNQTATVTGTGSVVLGTAPTISGAVLTGATSIAGTVAADSATAGKVGEYQEVNCGVPAASGTTVSFTSATPTVGTWTAHPFLNTGVGFGNYACPFTITATAPTGLSTSTNYWAVPIDANTFNVATSAANAAAGTFAATSGTSSTSNLTNSLALSTTAGLAPAMVKLTAGDWDCQGTSVRVLGASTSVTNMQTGINSLSTAMGGFGTFFDLESAANVMTATNNPVFNSPTVRLNLSATTAEYLVALDTFTVSTDTASGFMRCRRIR